MTDFNITLENDDLILRPLKESDFEEIKKLTGNPKVWDYFTSDLSDPESLQKWILLAVEAMEKKERMAFAVINKRTNKIIGSTSLGNHSKRDKRIEIGWTWMSELARGTGLNQKVKKLLLTYCFDELHLERVEAKTDVLNIGARKGLERSGFTEEGVLRSHTLLANGRRRDSIFYSVLRNEWVNSDNSTH